MKIASLDFETTGLVDPDPVSVAVVHIESGMEPVTALYTLVKPRKPIEPTATRVHGITEDMVADARPWLEVVRDVVAAIDGCDAIVCHNSPYDVPILIGACRDAGLTLPTDRILCTLVLSRHVWGAMGGNKLDDVSARLGVNLTNAHNAEADATAAGLIFEPLLDHIRGDSEAPSLDDLAAWTIERGAAQEKALRLKFNKRGPLFWAGLRESIAALPVGSA